MSILAILALVGTLLGTGFVGLLSLLGLGGVITVGLPAIINMIFDLF